MHVKGNYIATFNSRPQIWKRFIALKSQVNTKQALIDYTKSLDLGEDLVKISFQFEETEENLKKIIPCIFDGTQWLGRPGVLWQEDFEEPATVTIVNTVFIDDIGYGYYELTDDQGVIHRFQNTPDGKQKLLIKIATLEWDIENNSEEAKKLIGEAYTVAVDLGKEVIQS